ncbi:helix-turn-helix transcriptional regulator [Streptomyces sp. NBC_01304]|uniref:helix-turn-helix transcriptional regulator n=1 Tax=Streptomyces sp. NBC_01304 TaxID=2903818 RepID=UPI002E1103C9|nr:XRE family transcriptional regulator [Streptomyces sp. NBC_01304]
MGQKGDGIAEPPEVSPPPALVRTPAEFTAALRTLRLWSGLTYRQLEGKANAQADTLPASTIATTLGRVTLPREQFVDAFTRACGLGDEEVRQWVEARRRIATAAPTSTSPSTSTGADGYADPAVAPSRAPAPIRPSRWRRAAGLLGAAGIGIAGTFGVSGLLHDSSTPAALPAMPVAGLRMPAVGSWARIHPARTPELCLTEGRDRTGRYESAVVAQRLCTKDALPQVFLEPLGRDIVQIQWHQPKYGIGCLTVLQNGPGRDLLEPRDDCADDNRAQQFRVERFGPSAAAHFRIRPIITNQCLSLRRQDTKDGAEAVQGRCSGAGDQDFLIELTPPPQTTAAHAPSPR